MTTMTMGITPDLTTYSNTTRLMIEKWSKVAASISEDWWIIKDPTGEIVDAIPQWSVVFKDGSEAVFEPDGKMSPPEIGIFDCKAASKRSTQDLINKFFNSFKSIEQDFLVAENDFGEIAAILPRRRFVFKTSEDIVDSLKYIPRGNNQNNGGN